MDSREIPDQDDDLTGGEAMDTGLFDADQIVREFESQAEGSRKRRSESAWQRVENLLERKRLKESLKDLYDDDFLDDD